ncbi:MAG TPA: substrate-binding domain-containing protein [bacterium]
MFKITISPQWHVEVPSGLKAELPKLFSLLSALHTRGNLRAACRDAGVSYRHAWGLVRDYGQTFGTPLVRMTRGQGAQLTALGERLLWADKRIAARLSPVLDSLASEIQMEIDRVMSDAKPTARIHASHGFAVEALHDALVQKGVPLELKYCGSTEALASLCRSGCDLAGFHVPLGDLETAALRQYDHYLKPRAHMLVNIATRRQGIAVAKGNPKGILALADLGRPNIRFVNRQPGSGTRILLDLLLAREGIDSNRIRGYENGEHTHAAVAAFIASGMADAGFGVETAARRFDLDFVPIATERYLFACHRDALAAPQVRVVLDILASREFRAVVNNLPGYDATQCGLVQEITEAFPVLQVKRAAEKPIRKKAAARAR